MDPLLRIRELLALEGGISALTPEQLGELLTNIQAAAGQLGDVEPTAEVLETLNEVAEAADAHRNESTRRDEEAAQNEAAAQAAIARINGTTTDPEPDTVGDAPAEGDADDDAGDGTAAGDGAADAPADAPAEPVADDVREPIAASAQRPSLRELAARTRARTTPRQPQPQNAATPATPRGSTTYQSALTGRQIGTRPEIVDALARTIRQHGQQPGSALAVSAHREFPEDRRLLNGMDARNDALVAAAVDNSGATDLQPLVAAGGLCAPIENLYDVEVIGDTARPVRDALAPFGADRGGVSLRQGPYFGAWSSSSGVWTSQNDMDNANAVGSPPPTKGKFVATCPGFVDFEVQAVYTRVEFRNVTSRFDPEGTAANLAAAEIWRARYAENLLLSQIAAQSLDITGAKVLGATRDLLVGLDRIIGAWRSRYRSTVTLEAFLPMWVKDLMRADITRGELSLDALAVADPQIEAFFTRRNVMPVWHLDGNTAATTSPTTAAQTWGAQTDNTAAVEFPDQVEVLLHPAGSFLFLDGGELNIGTVRDTTTNANNTYEIFFEEWEAAAFRGTTGQSLRYVATLDPTGMSAGRLDTSAISD